VAGPVALAHLEALEAVHDALVGESLAGMAKRFGLLARFTD
jgi:hypothetical protein